MEMRPANSMQGFLSVSLRVPSTDPLPLEPLDAAPMGTPREHHLPVTPPETTHPHNYDILEEDEEGGRFTLKKQDLGSRGERGDGGKAGVDIGLNPDNRTDLTHVVNANSQEQESQVTTITTSSTADKSATTSTKEHDYLNTSIHSNKPLDTSLSQKNKSANKDGRNLDEDGYDMIARDQSLDINYDEVTLPERSVGSTGKKVGEHGYAVLEDKKLSIKEDGYSTTQTHVVLVVPNPNAKGTNGSGDGNSNECGVVVEADTLAHSLSRGSSVKKSLSLTKDSKTRSTEAGYDAPWVSQFPLPGRRVTHTSNVTHSTDKDKTSDIFDDPAYSTSSGTFSSSSGANKPGTPSSASSYFSSSHPRTRSLQQERSGNPPRKHRDAYETTAGIGDISEPEPAETPAHTQTVPATAPQKASAREVYEETGPKKASARDVYEESAPKKASARDVYEESAPKKASARDVYEDTSKILFDDPMYDIGLNLKK